MTALEPLTSLPQLHFSERVYPFPRTLHRVVYTADLHGNEDQYRALVSLALEQKADSLIIGGDILPKEPFGIGPQREFIEETLPNLLNPLLGKTKTYLLMGNDDCAANLDALALGDGFYYNIIHERRLALDECFDIVGYSYVPITPFGLKDWEKFDHREMRDMDLHPRNAISGIRSEEGRFRTSAVRYGQSIEADLEAPLYQANAKNTVYVMHAPPFQTALDYLDNGLHVGSKSIRRFIEETQPFLTLHGHLHDTVDKSGRFYELIGETLCMAPGNDHFATELSTIVFDLENLQGARFRVIDV